MLYASSLRSEVHFGRAICGGVDTKTHPFSSKKITTLSYQAQRKAVPYEFGSFRDKDTGNFRWLWSFYLLLPETKPNELPSSNLKELSHILSAEFYRCNWNGEVGTIKASYKFRKLSCAPQQISRVYCCFLFLLGARLHSWLFNAERMELNISSVFPGRLGKENDFLSTFSTSAIFLQT